MPKLVGDRLVKTFQLYMGQLRKDVGRSIIIWYKTGDPTSTGAWDPVNEETVSSDDTKDDTKTVHTINNVSVRYGPEPERFISSPGGRLDVDQIRLRCNLEDIIIDGSNINSDTYFDNAIKVIVDGRDYRPITNVIRSGLRDLFTATVICQKM